MTDGDNVVGLYHRLEAAIDRNVMLILALRHVTHQLHWSADEPGHLPGPWAKCTHKLCAQALTAIEGSR